MGFALTTLAAGLLAVTLLLALAGFVLRHRPQDMGLLPDGLAPAAVIASTDSTKWTGPMALRTVALRTVMATFGIGMMVQIGFLTHQIALLVFSVGQMAASVTVSATAVAALVGRLALARFADQIDPRVTTAAVLLMAAVSLGAMAFFPSPSVMVGASIVVGLTVGNVTTLSPIIVRREFGAPAFGTIYGIASCGIQLIAALGPGFYGLLHDVFGSYRPALIIAAVLDIAAATIAMVARFTPTASALPGAPFSDGGRAGTKPNGFE